MNPGHPSRPVSPGTGLPDGIGGETLDRLYRQRADLLACIAANTAVIRSTRDTVTRAILTAKTAEAAKYLNRVTNAIIKVGRGEIGDWSPAAFLGPNGHGPAIDNIINASARHREAVQIGKAA